MKKTALLAILALSLLALGLGYMMEQQSSQSAELTSQALMNLAPEQLDIAEVDGVEIITAGNKETVETCDDRRCSAEQQQCQCCRAHCACFNVARQLHTAEV